MDRRIGVMVAAGLAVSLAAPTLAQDGSGAPPSGLTTLVEGLDAPRGMAWGPDGTLYVAETGEGGEQCMAMPDGTEACAGTTAGISSIVDGVATRVVENLFSVAQGEEIIGAADVAVTADGTFIVPMPNFGGTELRGIVGSPLGDHLGFLASAAPDGTLTDIADLVQFEVDNNPDADDPGSSIDSNPNGVAIAPDGSYLVTDAGGNSLLMVAADGTITLGAVFHAQFKDDPFASPDPAGSPVQVPMQAVPTSVTIGPDGAAYVGQLTGFPFPVGGASVWRVEPGGEPTQYATGFTNIIDIAFGPDGTLYVAEIAHNSLLSGDLTGGLWSVPPGGGEPTLLASDGLLAPGGVTVGPDGTVYLSTGAVMPNGGAIVTWSPS
jgi:sugar lactone lactonase YvrE